MSPPDWYQRVMWRAWMTIGPIAMLLPFLVVAAVVWAALAVVA